MLKSVIESVTYELEDTNGPETLTKETHDIKMVFLQAHSQIVYAFLPHDYDFSENLRSGFMVSAMHVTEVKYSDGTTLTAKDI